MKIVERDCGDYVELIPQGLLVNSDKVVAMAGPAELLPRKANSTYFTVPPIVFKCPKELPENMTLETLANQIYQEAIDKFKVSFKEGFEKATARNQTAHTVTHEDNSMDQEEAGAGGGADILGMKELHSSLDNCAKGHCAACNVNCKGMSHKLVLLGCIYFDGKSVELIQIISPFFHPFYTFSTLGWGVIIFSNG